MTKKNLHILTGYSGSGKTLALRCFEENGYYCIDNLPAALLPQLTQLIQQNKVVTDIVVVIDARGQAFMKSLKADIEQLHKHFHVQIVFFDCSLESVTRRFKESRLKHPLSLSGSIKEGYKEERKALNMLRQMANITLNTSFLDVHAHKTLIRKYIKQKQEGILEVHLMSFGFKYGVPFEADLVIDVRFLKNPYFDPKLSKKNGLDRTVQNFVLNDPRTKQFMSKTKSYLDFLIGHYKKEGKSYVRVAFGCTGGKHRSVTIVENMKKHFLSKKSYTACVEHRDISEY